MRHIHFIDGLHAEIRKRKEVNRQLVEAANGLIQAMEYDHRPEGRCGPTKQAALDNARAAIKAASA